jgi:pimeloyl-ACP methyl ester carboxylesterase
MDTAIDRSRPPARQLLWLELRGIWELQAFFAAYPLLRLAPRGDGHPVLVLPGLAASDTSTRPLRAYLTEQGYTAHGWKQGRNHGPRPGVEAGIDARLAELSGRYRRKVSLIGWSLGGVFARELARAVPALVRQVITLGSPFANEPKASNAWPALRSPERALRRRLARAGSDEAPATGAKHGNLHAYRRYRRVAGMP